MNRILLPFALALAGCFAADEPEPCALAAATRTLANFQGEAVDLLFVIDNSRSMAPYQEALRRELPKLVRGLATGDHDDDPSTPSFPPVSSLRVGFITTDMGQAGLGNFPDDIVRGGCETGRYANYGDDGELIDFAIGQNRDSNPTGLDCDFDRDGVPDVLSPTALPPFLTFLAAEGEPDPVAVNDFVRRASCFGLAGIGGCGSEMPLEAALKALTPRTSPTRFFSLGGDGREFGHGDDPNSNGPWIRSDSVLGVLVLTDEDDCSSHERKVFDWGAGEPFADPGNPAPGDPSSSYALSFQAPANTRCLRFESALLEVDRFVEGLLALRGDPRRVVFSAITGVPPDLVDDVEAGEGSENLGPLLDDPRMAYEVIPNADGVPFAEIRTVCSNCPTCEPSDVRATPARRIAATAEGLRARGASVLLQSICEESFSGAVEHILSKLGVALAPTCVQYPLTRGDDGRVPCHAATTLPEGEHCADLVLAGYEPEPLRVVDGHEVCRFHQLAVDLSGAAPVVEAGAGYYLDDFSDASRRCGADSMLVVLQGEAALRDDAPTNLQCVVEGPPPAGVVDVGSPCEATEPGACDVDAAREAELVADYGIEGRNRRANPELLRCESRTSTCQMTCVEDTDCPLGTVCDDGDDRIDWPFFPRCVFPGCR